MKVVMLSNFINHHQAPVAEEMYHSAGVEYWFIETMSLPIEQKNLGYSDFSEKEYVVQAYKSEEQRQYALKLIDDADVVIVGSAPEDMIEGRLKKNKLTFRYAERYFKKRPWYYPDPRVWWSFYKKHIRYRKKNVYMLAASAYTANDLSHFFAYPNKVYRWGYFPSVKTLQISSKDTRKQNTISIMWCARFLDWKHPELPVKLAKLLVKDGYKFQLDMYGSGEKMESTIALAKLLGVEEYIFFKGNTPNEDVIQAMRDHDIFLFTSDKGEGWGAVLNESMSQGCAVVASDMIGSAPFLIKDGINGLLFKSEDIISLYTQVKKLFENEDFRHKLSKNAILTMNNVWSPQNAAHRFLCLVEKLLEGDDTEYEDGPCSKAYPYKNI